MQFCTLTLNDFPLTHFQPPTQYAGSSSPLGAGSRRWRTVWRRWRRRSRYPAWTPGAFYDGGVMGRVVGRSVWVLWGICGLGVVRGPHEPPASVPQPHHPPPQNDTHPQHKHSETSIGEVVSTNGVELDAALDALGKKAGAQEVAARQEKLEKAVAEVREEVWLVLVVLWWGWGEGLVWFGGCVSDGSRYVMHTTHVHVHTCRCTSGRARGSWWSGWRSRAARRARRCRGWRRRWPARSTR